MPNPDRIPRSNWCSNLNMDIRRSLSRSSTPGVRHPESIAEHSFRTAVIGYLLAHLEGANPERTALIWPVP
jgi:5'-deoxynucleotidase YfbR-like HD superfamily hydrolase